MFPPGSNKAVRQWVRVRREVNPPDAGTTEDVSALECSDPDPREREREKGKQRRELNR